MFGTMGGLEILIILVIGIVIFGVIKLPGIVRMLGSGVSGYNKLKKGFSFSDVMDKLKGDEQESSKEPPQQQWAAPPPGWQPPPQQPYYQPPDQQWNQPPPGWQPWGQQYPQGPHQGNSQSPPPDEGTDQNQRGNRGSG